jgi:Integrase core domain
VWVPETLRTSVTAGSQPDMAQHDPPGGANADLSDAGSSSVTATLSSPRRSTRCLPRSTSGSSRHRCGRRGANAIAERFVGSVRRELLDIVLIINQWHAAAVLRYYVQHYNNRCPHRALSQAAPLRPLPDHTATEIHNVRRRDRLGGLITNINRSHEAHRIPATHRSEGIPLMHLLRYGLFGQGEVPPVTRGILRQAGRMSPGARSCTSADDRRGV